MSLSEREILLEIFECTNGEKWKKKKNWGSDKPLGEWYGVVVDKSGNIVKLDLYDNRLSGSIPASIGGFLHLQYLALNKNQLSGEIPHSIGNLINLTVLRLDKNVLTGEIPDSIGNLVKLTHLYLGDPYLGGNKLTGNIPFCIGNLTNLVHLYLYGNQLSGPIPASIGELTKLIHLVLYGNQLSGDLPASLQNLTNLTQLCLSSNKFTGGYEYILNLTNLTSLLIDGTLVDIFKLPPEFHDKDIQDVFTYVRARDATSTSSVEVKRMKVMVIGNGDAGKTTLVHRMKTGEFNNEAFDMTDGIQMTEYKHSGIEFSVWDLGGQCVYMNTHTLFFTSQTLYIIVVNPSKKMDDELLREISQFYKIMANYAPLSPLIIVSTRKLSAGHFSESLVKQVTSLGLNSISYVAVDSSTGDGLAELKAKIVEISSAQDYITQRIPRSFDNLRQSLIEFIIQGRFHLSQREFECLATEVIKLKSDEARVAKELFHQWGIVHVLGTGEIILKPQQLADVFACVITAQKSSLVKLGETAVQGYLPHSDIHVVWDKYSESLRSSFLEMLHDHELAFALYDSNGSPRWISVVPSMLPFTQSDVNEDFIQGYFPVSLTRMPTLRLRTDHLPENFTPRLFSRLRRFIVSGSTFRNCALLYLKEDNSMALIVEDRNNHDLQIFGCGNTKARSLASNAILQLQQDSFPGLRFEVSLHFGDLSWKENEILDVIKAGHYAIHIGQEGSEDYMCVTLCGVVPFLLHSIDNQDSSNLFNIDPNSKAKKRFDHLDAVFQRLVTLKGNSDFIDLIILLIHCLEGICELQKVHHIKTFWLTARMDDGSKIMVIPLSLRRYFSEGFYVVNDTSISLPMESHNGIDVNEKLSKLVIQVLRLLGTPYPLPGSSWIGICDLQDISTSLLETQMLQFHEYPSDIGGFRVLKHSSIPAKDPMFSMEDVKGFLLPE